MQLPQFDKQNILYLYDLPKDSATSVKIAKVFKDQAGLELDMPPQIRRDITKPFYSAMVKINDPDKFKTACEKMRYFEIEGKPCRALPFDKDLLGSNRTKIENQNVFVRKIPADVKAPQLEDTFKKFGDVKSVKISLNPDHSSRQYGFVCFQEPEGAQQAIDATKKEDLGFEIQRYQPKDRRDMRKAFNNIYVKNFPTDWTEADIRKYFEPFGNILSVYLMKNEKGAFAFICYGDKDNKDREYGPKCAMRAVDELNGKKIDEEHTLYVKEALKKEERAIEKTKEMLRYKNSKKRCNLYVKNFPPTTTKEQLEELFGRYGEIENIKLFPKEGEVTYAFVCYKNPESATRAKAELPSQPFQGRQLYINHYEIKELRQVQLEDIRDRTDFQNFKKQNLGYTADLFNKPEIYALLNQIFTFIQPKLRGQFGGPNNMRRGPHQRFPPGQQRPGHMGAPSQMGGVMPPAPMAQGMPPMPGMPMRPPMMHPGQPPMGMPPGPNPMMMPPQGQLPLPQQYAQKGIFLLPAVVKSNPNYRNQVGEFIFEYVERIAGEEKAPKITGMLIDLPIEEIQGYLQDFSKLEEKVREADALLSGNNA